MKKPIPIGDSMLMKSKTAGCVLGAVLCVGATVRAEAAAGPKVILSTPVVVAQASADKAQPAWGRWQFPVIERLADGRLHVKWSVTADSVRVYGANRAHAISSDGGKTWQRIGQLEASHLRGGVLLPNGDRLKLAQEPSVPVGEVDLPTPIRDFGAYWPAMRGAHYKFYRRSDFSGKMLKAYPQMRMAAGTSTWVREYPKVDIPGQVIWQRSGALIRPFFDGMSELRQAPDGSPWTACYWPRQVNSRVTRYIPTFVRSTDNGRTWRFVSDIPTPPGIHGLGFCEPDLAFTPDGSMITLLRTGGPSYIARSTDHGKHWHKPVIFDRLGVMPQLLALKDGVILASYGRPGVRVRASSDPAGMQWGDPVEVPLSGSPRGTCAYTSLVALNDHQAMLAYSDFNYPGPNGKARKAICVRIVTVQPRRR